MFLYPFSDVAKIGILEIMFSVLKFICVPIIGCVPDLLIFSENSRAPHKLKLSQTPTDLILLFLQMSYLRIIPHLFFFASVSITGFSSIGNTEPSIIIALFILCKS